MDEWLKVHTYVVCNNTQTALDKMLAEYQHLCEQFGRKNTAKMNRKKLQIEDVCWVHQYISIRQILRYFSGVDDVDWIKLDDSLSNEDAGIIITIVDKLERAGIKKYWRAKQREEYYKEQCY